MEQRPNRLQGIAAALLILYRDFYNHLAKEKASDECYKDLEIFMEFLRNNYIDDDSLPTS